MRLACIGAGGMALRIIYAALLLVGLAGMTSFFYEGSLVHGVSNIVLLFLRSGGGTTF